jgi:mannose-1-phosphate guanylyltransferase
MRDMDDLYAVIMVGGAGERLWPLSTKDRPKPFLCFFGKEPMVKETVKRIEPLIGKEKIRLVLSKPHRDLAEPLFPEFSERNYITEPEPKDTAAAIGLSMVYLPKGSTVVVLSADHWILEKERFIECIERGIRFVERNPDFLVTLGIKPTRAETGYGWLEAEDVLSDRIRRVKRFVEKPNKEKAEEYLKDPNYYWNSGMFIWKREKILDCFSQFMPTHSRVFSQIESAIGTEREEERKREGFSRLQKVSIDYGIMEKAEKVAMVEASFGWDDVGTWVSLLRIHQQDENRNLMVGDCIGIETEDCIVYSEDGKIATFGVSNLVIVHSKKKTLICSKDKATELKRLVREIKG